MSSINNVIESTIDLSLTEQNPVDLLALETGISKSKIKQAMTAGAVWLKSGSKTKRIRRAKTKLPSSGQLSIHYDEKILSLAPLAPKLIADESSFSIWYKPAGLMSSGTKFGDHCAINRWVETNHLPQRPVFIVHRLDRFATGLMILAHTKQAAGQISEQFQHRSVRKVYQVIVHGIVEDTQTLDSPIDGKKAESIISPLEHHQNRTLLQVEIKTGRKHQIRRHLSLLGHPVVGDRQYGTTQTGELQLTACELAFKHPKTGVVKAYELSQELRPKLNP